MKGGISFSDRYSVGVCVLLQWWLQSNMCLQYKGRSILKFKELAKQLTSILHTNVCDIVIQVGTADVRMKQCEVT